jgi:hypothetical protein
MITFLFLSLFTVDALVNTNARCLNQIVQYCGKVTKRFNAETDKWEDGFVDDIDQPCWDQGVFDAPPPPTTCAKAFPGQRGTALRIGNATFTFCTSSVSGRDCSEVSRRPIFVCGGGGVVGCCVEVGQYTSEFVNATGPRICSQTTTTETETETKTSLSSISMSMSMSMSVSMDTDTDQTETTIQINSTKTLNSQPNNLLGPIIGGVVGGIVFIGLLIGLFVYLHRRRRHRQNACSPQPDEKKLQMQTYSLLPAEKTYGDVSDVRKPYAQH